MLPFPWKLPGFKRGVSIDVSKCLQNENAVLIIENVMLLTQFYRMILNKKIILFT
jgi:hypothetical protein